jgi:hypothetical protein
MIAALILWMVGWYYVFIIGTLAALFAAYGVVALIERLTK